MNDRRNKNDLPTKKPKGHFVQTDRATHEAWARLTASNAKAGSLLHLLAANVGENNAVVASHGVLADLLGCSVSSIQRALVVLKKGNWIEQYGLGKTGSVQTYVINSRVAWAESRDKLRYARLSAQVLLSEKEQKAGKIDQETTPLRKLPRNDELQIPSGDGLPPVSQPSLAGMEPDLPGTGDQIDIESYIKDQ